MVIIIVITAEDSLGLAVSMVAFKGTQSNVPLRGGNPAVSNDTSGAHGYRINVEHQEIPRSFS